VDVRFEARDVAKRFGRRLVLRSVSFSVEAGGVVVVAGRNGSGKSTLLKILVGLLTPSRGDVVLAVDGRKILPERQRNSIGFVSPYLQLYDEFTGVENLALAASLRGMPFDTKRADELLKMVGLDSRGSDPAAAYSSGMKQRLKYAFALMHRPPVLVLDEPTANLDSEGMERVRQIIAAQREAGVVILAANEPEEREWGDSIIDLDHQDAI